MAVMPWMSTQAPSSAHLRGVASDGTTLVAVGDSGTIITSQDGANWTTRTAPDGGYRDVTYGAGLFVAVGRGTTLATSPDGVTWTDLNLSFSNGRQWEAVTYGGGLFVAVGDDKAITTSPDGETWTTRLIASTGEDFKGVAYGNGLFVAVGDATYTSSDGVDWSSPWDSELNFRANDLTFGADLFVAAAAGRIYTSPDGAGWVQRTTSGWVRAVTYGPDRFVAAGEDILTSTNGLAWSTEVSSVSPSMQGVGYGRGKFVAVGEQGHIYNGVYNRPPQAPTLTGPAADAVLDLGVGQRFAWAFNDPDPGDSQSAYRVRYRAVGGSVWTDTGWVSSPSTRHDFPAGTFTAGDYEWQVATKDARGLEGPFSSSGFFTAATPPEGPQITTPANGATVPEDQVTVTWSVPDQDAYQAQVLDSEDVVLVDTGTVERASVRTWAAPLDDNDTTRQLRVRARFEGLWSPWSTVTVDVSYTTPETPTVAVHEGVVEGALVVQATHPAPGDGVPAVEYIDVYRREVNDTGSGIRRAAGLLPTETFTDHWVASGVEYAYRVRAFGTNGTSVWSQWTQEPADTGEWTGPPLNLVPVPGEEWAYTIEQGG